MASFIQDLFEIYEAKRRTKSYRAKQALCCMFWVFALLGLVDFAIVGMLSILSILHK